MVLAIGLVCFLLALAAWRWGLGNRNWLEGSIVALVVALLVITVLHVAQRHRSRRAGSLGGNPYWSRPARSDIR